MTREEAIRVLENYKPKVKRATLAAKRAKEAFDMAISALSENKGECISIDDVMSVFDDFMCGEVDEEGRATFLEMLKDKAESEDK